MRIRKHTSRGLVALAVVGLAVAATALAPLASADDPPATNDWRVGYDQEFDNSLNPFAAQFTSDYFVFTEVYDLLLNFTIADNSPDKANSYAQELHVLAGRQGLDVQDPARHEVGRRRAVTADDVVWTLQTVIDTADDPGNVLSGYLPTRRQDREGRRPDGQDHAHRAERADDVALHPDPPEAHLGEGRPEEDQGLRPLHRGHRRHHRRDEEGDHRHRARSWSRSSTRAARRSSSEPVLLRAEGRDRPHPDGQVRRQGPAAARHQARQPRRDAVRQPEVGDGRGGRTRTSRSGRTRRPGFSEIAFNSCTGAAESLCTGVGKGVHKDVVQDPAIRHALYYALNRPEVLKTVLQNQGTVGNGLISPYYARYYQDFSKDPEVGYQYDPAKAKEILADGRLELPGRRHLHEERRPGLVRAARPPEQPGRPERRPAVRRRRQGGRHRHEARRSCPRTRSTSGSTPPARRTRTSTSRPTTRSTGAGAATTTRRRSTSTCSSATRAGRTRCTATRRTTSSSATR